MFLRWKMSDSYDLICMTAPAHRDRMDEAYTGLKREIYGIRFVPRAKWNQTMADSSSVNTLQF